MAFGEKKFVESFYHLKDVELNSKYCSCLACFVSRDLNKKRWDSAVKQQVRIYNLGKGYIAPESTDEDATPFFFSTTKSPIILNRILKGGATSIKQYLGFNGYKPLQSILKKPPGSIPSSIIDEIIKSKLRGRGGAGFPTGDKLRMVAKSPNLPKYVVVNADEGDAGSFIDRFIMEMDPFLLIEATTIAGFAVGAEKGIIYLRKEYLLTFAILNKAIAEARTNGWLGERINGSEFSFDIDIFIGNGSYVCGEESALLNSIEGKRPEVRARPPYPTESGLFGKPTLVNNVETLASIPWIVENGGDSYSKLGFSNSRGTKVLSLNSLFNRPGLYEVEFGITIRKIIEELGKGLKQEPLKGIIIGGPLAGIIPPNLLDTQMGFEELRKIGANVGHGGVIPFSNNTSIAELLYQVFRFGAFESCGKCTPCRVGTQEIENIFSAIVDNKTSNKNNLNNFSNIIETLSKTSLCGHGTGLAEFAQSAMRYYSEEVESCFK